MVCLPISLTRLTIIVYYLAPSKRSLKINYFPQGCRISFFTFSKIHYEIAPLFEDRITTHRFSDATIASTSQVRASVMLLLPTVDSVLWITSWDGRTHRMLILWTHVICRIIMTIIEESISGFRWICMFSAPITVATRSEAWTVFARSNTGIVGSNPTQGVDVCIVRLFCVCVVLCVGRGLATGWSTVQGVLPTVYRIKILKKRPRPNKGL
jgi:hypothetical protein